MIPTEGDFIHRALLKGSGVGAIRQERSILGEVGEASDREILLVRLSSLDRLLCLHAW